ncbi:molybdopterin cofactor-binding domain-containing protein [Sphingomonas sp. GCM10030256]|uniref:molybdopterin cofactor-binding domain-containing protein n=1 Tax=Sphingomonas sp. GCM10030256 TaxID=3273427 RepID=UPI00361B0F7E
MKLDRRTLLIGGGAGIGLVLALAAWPRRIGGSLPLREEDRGFDHFLKIGTDGRVTVAVPQVETGQGIWTALPQIVADELGAAWDMVAVEPAPSSPFYANPLAAGWTADVVGGWRAHRLKGDGSLRITANSTSVRGFEGPLRRSAATARAMLCAAAADQWNVAAAECDTAGGFVVHEGKRFGFGALAEAAADGNPPDPAPLRSVGTGKLAGQSLPRLDLPGKTDGSARLAADVRLPGLLFASVRLAPPGGRLTAYERDQVKSGTRLIADGQWLAAVGTTWWAAEQALRAAAPRFTGPKGADSAALERVLEEAFAGGEPTRFFARGDFEGAAAGSRPLAATYAVGAGAHHGLEPPTATARLVGDRLEVWASTLAPELARQIAATAAGVALAQTTLYPMPVGGGDGRALEAEAVGIAAVLAKRAGHPVQLILAPEEARRHDRPRPPALARLFALPTPAGGIAAWKVRIASVGGLTAALGRMLEAGPASALDAREWSGAVPPYAIANVAVDGVAAELPIRTSYLRGGMDAPCAFFTESFVDEMARIAGVEPLAFRMGLLGGQPRLARVLSNAATLGGWDGGAPGSTMGLACVSAFGSHIGLIASATLGADQTIQVDRLIAAVDCGRAVNPGLIRQQIEGGLLAGLAQATARVPAFRYGLADGLGSPQPRLGRAPRIEVELLPSREIAGGVSGLGFAAVAPAVGNAIAAATGRRLRRLPFDPMSAA